MEHAEYSEFSSNLGFRMMGWTYKLRDLFHEPTRRLDKVPIDSGQTVVDYACGPGRYIYYLARRVGPKGRVYAVDIHPQAIQMVKGLAEKNGLSNVEEIRCENFDTGIPASSVDLIVFLDALHQIRDHEQLFSEMHRILKPEGRVFMEPGHMKFPRAKEIVVETGLFTIESTWYHEHELLLAPIKSQPEKSPIHWDKKKRMRCLCIA
jgi:ubiquinone/menaquinone biosynthesis C-methylase UbiE